MDNLVQPVQQCTAFYNHVKPCITAYNLVKHNFSYCVPSIYPPACTNLIHPMVFAAVKLNSQLNSACNVINWKFLNKRIFFQSTWNIRCTESEILMVVNVTGDLKDTLVLLTPVELIFLLTNSSILSTVQPWRFSLVT
jgi:hypothetical protein